jgi:hypothetical protein
MTETTHDCEQDTPPEAPGLSADECQRVRAMLAQFDQIAHGCPVARQILSDE